MARRVVRTHSAHYHCTPRLSYRVDLLTSVYPVIWGVPPTPDSAHENGRRQFADGRIDRAGLARLTGNVASGAVSKPAAATQREDSMEESSESSASDADSESDSPPTRKLRPRRKTAGSDNAGQILDGDIFRRVAVPISTTPIKSRPARVDSPEHISIPDGSSGDETDE